MKKFYLLLSVLILAGALHGQTCEQYIGGYIPSWRNPSTVDFSKLSHVFYAFATTNVDGDLLLDNQEVFNTFNTASAGKQRFLSLGGGGNNAFSTMAGNATTISTFAEKCVAFCTTNNLQGIDVDWEGIITPEDSLKFGNFVREMATQLHANDLKLIITLAYGSYGGDHYNVGAMKKADWIQLMVYDQTGTWADSPYGNHSSYQQMLDAITYWKNRGYTDVSKMVIGLPFYGYKFNSTSGGLATALTYSEIVAAHPNLTCVTDEVSLTVFNGPATLRSKVMYVKENGLKGVMIWELGQDINSAQEKSLLNAVSKAACGEDAACVDDVISAVAEKLEERIFVTNPVQNTISISLQNVNDKIYSLELVDNLGRSIKKENSSSETNSELNVSNHATGIYYLRITLQNHQTVVKRIIKI